jgi:hypothetical protein
MGAVTDPRCTTLEHGDVDGTRLIDTQRALRLIEAHLQEDQHSANLVTEQLGDCDNCVGGVMTYLVAFCSMFLYELESSQELAVHRVQQELAKVLDEMRTHR